MTEAKREYMRQWRAANKERLQAYRKEYRAANLEREQERDRQRYRSDPEGQRARVKDYYERNREQVVAREAARRDARRERYRSADKKWRDTHPERQQAKLKAWHLANPGKNADYSAKRRARIDAQDPNPETIDRMAIYDRDGGRCHICRRHVSRASFHLDHLVPIARGGLHRAENVAIAHPRCNLSRGPGRKPAQLILGPMLPRELQNAA